jgi:hypothetical protein
MAVIFLEISKKESKMEKEFLYLKIILFMKEILKTTFFMEKEYIDGKMVLYMKESFSRDRFKA